MKGTPSIERIGQSINDLTILSVSTGETPTRAVVLCRCGKTKTVALQNVVSGMTKTCGCAYSRAKATHGLSKTGTYRSWAAMHARCTNEANKAWKDYGGRGIAVCSRWGVFENFLADMGHRPDGKSLDRYPNNNGNYEPNNCRWATPGEQAQNKRRRKAA